MDDVLKLIYANFLLVGRPKVGKGYPDWTAFVFDILRDNHEIKDQLLDFIDKYATSPNNFSVWRVKLIAHQWAPSEDI